MEVKGPRSRSRRPDAHQQEESHISKPIGPCRMLRVHVWQSHPETAAFRTRAYRGAAGAAFGLRPGLESPGISISDDACRLHPRVLAVAAKGEVPDVAVPS